MNVFKKILNAFDGCAVLDVDVRVELKTKVWIVRDNPSVVHLINLVVPL
jgi:hypothetical protein